jgi:hypothetical protein
VIDPVTVTDFGIVMRPAVRSVWRVSSFVFADDCPAAVAFVDVFVAIVDRVVAAGLRRRESGRVRRDGTEAGVPGVLLRFRRWSGDDLREERGEGGSGWRSS